jgi:hypothetical protein
MPDYCPSDWAASGDPRLEEEPPEPEPDTTESGHSLPTPEAPTELPF